MDSDIIAGIALIIAILAAVGMAYNASLDNPEPTDLTGIRGSMDLLNERIVQNTQDILILDGSDQQLQRDIFDLNSDIGGSSRRISNNDLNNVEDDIDDVDDRMRDIEDCLIDESNYSDFQECVDNL